MCNHHTELARSDLDLEALGQEHPADSSRASGSLIRRHRRMKMDRLRTGPVPGCSGHEVTVPKDIMSWAPELGSLYCMCEWFS